MRAQIGSHMWGELNGDVVTLGVTEKSPAGRDVVSIECPAPGMALTAGQPMISIEVQKTVVDLDAPFSGEVLELNPLAFERPRAIGDDPEGVGWILKMRLADPSDFDAHR